MRNLMIFAHNMLETRRTEEGQGVIEYALIIGLVSVVLAGALALAGGGWIDDVTAVVDDALS